jgi:ElaB/YqjD/DUF883 family membrane-anchored ribosome-binding protein
MKFRQVVFLLVLVLLLVSCATGTNINEKNNDGSPIWTTEIPKSNKLLYGVGKAKLTTDKNSQDASYSLAVSDLAKQISVRIDEATTYYSNDTNKLATTAYETIKITSVSLSVNGVVTEARWTAEDGTVWTLVSIKVKNLPKIYEEASNSYKKEQEEAIETIKAKLDALLSQIGDQSDNDSLTLKAAAEKKANELQKEIKETLSSVDCEGVRDEIEKLLIADGYSLED